MTDTLAELSAAGVAVWLDDLSPRAAAHRQPRRAGPRQARRRRHHQPDDLPEGAGRRRRLRRAGARPGRCAASTSSEAVRALTTYDVRWALRRAAAGATTRSDGVDGRVSIEVDPRLAHDTDKTVAEAKALWWLVDRPNLFIKIPATREGLPAITADARRGHQRQRHADLLAGALRRGHGRVPRPAWSRPRPTGTTCPRIGSVASFFVSRVDTEIDKRLDKIGTTRPKALRGKAAIANARLAYERYEKVFASDRWQALAAAGATPQRPLWASTGVKDPAYDDTHVRRRAGRARHGQHHAGGDARRGRRPRRDPRRHASRRTYAEAQQVLDDLEAVGIDYDDVVAGARGRGRARSSRTSWSELHRRRSTPSSRRRPSA